MELLKGQGAQERVKEVLRISSDGSMVKESLIHSFIYLLAHIFSILKMGKHYIKQNLRN